MKEHIIQEWHPKNKIKLNDISLKSGKKVWWKCKKGHEWKTSIAHRANGSNCPYCCNQKVCKDNCLSTTHPYLVEEWSNKNGIKPTEIVAGSDKKIWWKCKKCKNEWQLCLNARTSKSTNCPYCVGRKVYKNNCLYKTHPELAKEWNRRNKIKPNEITYGSNKKVWWKCKKGHEWKAKIGDRTCNKRNCPICNESKGEKEISIILDQLKIRYKREYKFKELGQKRFDFALFEKYKRKPFAVIEYQGKQHYKVCTFGCSSIDKINKKLKYTQENDQFKKSFCKNNNIKYIEIKYTQKNYMEEIIRNNL